MPSAAHARGQRLVAQEPLHRAGQPGDVVGIDEQAGASRRLPGSAPRVAATTGTPTVIASSTGMPKPSSNDGSTSSDASSIEALALGVR